MVYIFGICITGAIIFLWLQLKREQERNGANEILILGMFNTIANLPEGMKEVEDGFWDEEIQEGGVAKLLRNSIFKNVYQLTENSLWYKELPKFEKNMRRLLSREPSLLGEYEQFLKDRKEIEQSGYSS